MPEASQVHIDAALTNVSVAYRNTDYIADRLAPMVGVRKQSDKYFIYDAEREAFRQTDDRRAPGSEANEVSFAMSSGSYYCESHALEGVISDEERQNADPAIQVDIDHAEFLTDKIDLNREINLASTIIDGGSVPSTTLSGTDQWDDVDSDPIDAIESAKATIQAAAQVAPNTLVLPYEVYVKVRNHADIIDRVKYVTMGVVTPDVLAEVFTVDQVLIPRAQKNTANPGATASMTYIWGKNALLCHVPKRPGLKTVGLASTFNWMAAPGSVSGRLVEVWRDDARKSDLLRVERYYDHKLIAASAGYVWKAAVS